MWPLDEAGESAAKWITGILGGLAIAWKIFLRVRRDSRDDREDGAKSDGIELILERQQAEITRCHTRMHALEEETFQARRRAEHAEVALERANRRIASEMEVIEQYRARINLLEMDVQRLEQDKIDRGDNPFSPSADR